MDIQFVPRTESTVLDKRRPVEAALRKLKSGEMIVVCPATETTQHSFSTAARRLGIRIETALDGGKLEVALLLDRMATEPPKPPRGQLMQTVLAYIESQNGVRLVDVASACGITPQQANSAVKNLASRASVHNSAHKWFAGAKAE